MTKSYSKKRTRKMVFEGILEYPRFFFGMLAFWLWYFAVFLPISFVHDLRNGTLFFNGKCPNCKTKMTEHGFEGHNRRYECPKCGKQIHEVQF